MASVCQICQKKPSFGMSVSHSHRRTKRRWNPNIQRVRAIVDGTPRRVDVCTGCLKSGKVQKPTRARASEATVQGVIRSYDPSSGDGVILCDTDLSNYDLAADALEGSIFRMLRQGQRVVFDVEDGFATRLRLGSEVDMGTPAYLLDGALPDTDLPSETDVQSKSGERPV